MQENKEEILSFGKSKDDDAAEQNSTLPDTYADADADDIAFMQAAIDEARIARDEDEVPIGACIVRDGVIIARAHNTREGSKCATHHAEILAIEEACRALGGWRLPGATLYVTLEPCVMCAGAIINARIRNLYFGAYDPKAGCFGSLTDLNSLPFNHHPTVEGGILEEECREEVQDFFKDLRKNHK